MDQKLVSGIQNDRLRNAELYRKLKDHNAEDQATPVSKKTISLNVLYRSFQGLTKRFLT